MEEEDTFEGIGWTCMKYEDEDTFEGIGWTCRVEQRPGYPHLWLGGEAQSTCKSYLCSVVWAMLDNGNWVSNYWGVGHGVPANQILSLAFFGRVNQNTYPKLS